ncbi:hypothetical protein Tco_0513735 [Tanacetum coccineum]
MGEKDYQKVYMHARYDVDHWKNPWAQQDHIRRQLKTRDDPKKVYSKVKIVYVIRVLSNQGYGPEYIEVIMVKRTNSEYAEFAKSDYKHHDKNDIKDMYLMCINRKIKDYRETGLLKVLDKVKKFNLDVKHGYADPDLSNEDAEYMMFYEEYIQERLRHHDQMRH